MPVAHSTPAATAAILLARFKWQQVLSGVQDSANRVFTTPDIFLPDTIEVYHNGRKLSRVGSIQQAEYSLSESSGLGTGYDTITFNTFVPVTSSIIRVNYVTEA